MAITIGTRSLSATRPSDLEAKLVAATGCSVAESLAMIKNPNAAPFVLARIAAPMLTEPLPIGDLSLMIADDRLSVRQQLIDLLGEPADAAPAPAAGEVANG